LQIEDAEFPVLRMFVSWPGHSDLESTITLAKRKKRSWKLLGKKSASARTDQDKHPLATLNEEVFVNFGLELDKNLFRGVPS
jgi:hypothetical protein